MNTQARKFEIIDKQTGSRVGQPYGTRARANRRVDQLDNAYGAYRYYVQPIPLENCNAEESKS